MAFPFHPRCGTALLAMGCWLFLLLVGPKSQAEGERFSVMGWVKSKLSPEEEARSASRASRLRPLTASTDPSNQNAVTATSVPPHPTGILEAPRVDPYARQGAGLDPPHPVPSRPISREIANQPSGPLQPRQSPPVEAPPVGRNPGPAPVPASGFTGQPTVEELRRRAEYLATQGLVYKFGADHPSEGGMDCSGTMQFLLKSMGYPDIPRTSYDQYAWLADRGTLRKVGFFHSPDRAVNNLRPGDLIFWGGTYNSGHKVSHVMVYLGRSRAGKHYIFGARGKKVKGLNGSGVDIFELDPRSAGGKLVGYGHLPGLRN